MCVYNLQYSICITYRMSIHLSTVNVGIWKLHNSKFQNQTS